MRIAVSKINLEEATESSTAGDGTGRIEVEKNVSCNKTGLDMAATSSTGEARTGGVVRRIGVAIK